MLYIDILFVEDVDDNNM